jgi:hypothetical protein
VAEAAGGKRTRGEFLQRVGQHNSVTIVLREWDDVVHIK